MPSIRSDFSRAIAIGVGTLAILTLQSSTNPRGVEATTMQEPNKSSGINPVGYLGEPIGYTDGDIIIFGNPHKDTSFVSSEPTAFSGDMLMKSNGAPVVQEINQTELIHADQALLTSILFPDLPDAEAQTMLADARAKDPKAEINEFVENLYASARERGLTTETVRSDKMEYDSGNLNPDAVTFSQKLGMLLDYMTPNGQYEPFDVTGNGNADSRDEIVERTFPLAYAGGLVVIPNPPIIITSGGAKSPTVAPKSEGMLYRPGGAGPQA